MSEPGRWRLDRNITLEGLIALAVAIVGALTFLYYQAKWHDDVERWQREHSEAMALVMKEISANARKLDAIVETQQEVVQTMKLAPPHVHHGKDIWYLNELPKMHANVNHEGEEPDK